MYRVYLETSGNKPLIFGGGSPDMGASEDLSGVQLTKDVYKRQPQRTVWAIPSSPD